MTYRDDVHISRMRVTSGLSRPNVVNHVDAIDLGITTASHGFVHQGFLVYTTRLVNFVSERTRIFQNR